MFGFFVYFLGLIIGVGVYCLNGNFNFTLTPFIIGLNIITIIVFGYSEYKEFKNDIKYLEIFHCLLVIIFNVFLCLCLIYTEPYSPLFVVSTMVSVAITFSLFVVFLLYKIKNSWHLNF